MSGKQTIKGLSPLKENSVSYKKQTSGDESMRGLFDLTGKVALVTGSSRGLGKSLAEGLGEAGATLILNGTNPDNLNRAVSDLRARGLAAQGVLFDVTQPDQIRAGLDEIRKDHDAIDILVNNAGIQIRHPAIEFPFEDWDRMIRADLSSIFYVSRLVAPGMIERRSGKIINICSLLSEVARPTVSAYTAAKGGVKLLTKSMAVEWGPCNIQCNGIGPGYFDTEMNRALIDNPEFNAWVCKRTPLGRWGEPKDLKGPVVFLASSASDYVNGHILYIDGGLLAGI